MIVKRVRAFVPVFSRFTWKGTALAAAAAIAGSGCTSDQVPAPMTAPDEAGIGGEAGAETSAPMATCTSDDAGGGACDLTGRWLVALRVVADALGQTQASHNWFYYEIQQSGDQVTVTKGLQCGFEVKHLSVLGADVDTSATWPSLLTHDSDTGRLGTMTPTTSGCQFDLEKRYTVRGATVPYYLDPTTTMPTPDQQATGTTPGWEDWDGDGHPGITLTVSNAATGHLYCAQRDWNQYSGAVCNNATTFKVPATFDTGQDVLGYDGSQFITESSVPDPDPAQNYVWFAKLAPTEATGDDTAICAAVRALIPTKTPNALQ
jgi:hypothetical protein